MHRRAFCGALLSTAACALLPRSARASVERDDPALPHLLEECGLPFVRRAPHVVVHEAVLPAPPARVFDVLVAPEPWPRWLPIVQAVRYRDPKSGVGAERDVDTTFGTIRERFFAWERGQRFAFSVYRSSSPLARRFLEDYLLKPVQGGRTRLVWTIAFETAPLAAPLGPGFAAMFEAIGPSSLSRLGSIVSAPAA